MVASAQIYFAIEVLVLVRIRDVQRLAGTRHEPRNTLIHREANFFRLDELVLFVALADSHVKNTSVQFVRFVVHQKQTRAVSVDQRFRESLFEF